MNAGFQSRPIGKAVPKARFDLRARLWLVGGLLALGAVALLARAADLQIIDHEYYQREADARFLREVPIPTSRGMMTDRHGEPLAVSTPVASLAANPQQLSLEPDRLPELAQATGLDVEFLTRYVSERAGREFIYLPGQRRITPARANEVLALKIPGVFSRREYKRFYPQGEALAHVLGFTNIDDIGQEGLELAFDEWLAGTPGLQKIIREREGQIVEHIDLLRPAQPGRDLALSIDRRLQFLAHRELTRALDETKAKSGTVVMLDVATGEVLAMVNLPSYNNNNVMAAAREAWRNRAVTDLIEPGSTMKPLTIAAGLEAGVITPGTRIDTHPGWIANGRFRTTDFRNYGELDITGIITKSSNVGVSKVVQQLPSGDFYAFLRRFGFGESTHSGFPGESPGLLPEPSRWSGTSKQTMSYGYGLSVTPLQIAQAYAALGNGGKLIRPSFVKGGNDLNEDGVVRQVLEPGLARTLVEMMQTTTERGGTATRAAIHGYHVAGKTGTARRASAGGYDKRYVAFFAGLVPVEQPRFSMVVVVHDPEPIEGRYGGGVVAAPVFQRIMQDALRLMDVPPDNMGELRSAPEISMLGASR